MAKKINKGSVCKTAQKQGVVNIKSGKYNSLQIVNISKTQRNEKCPCGSGLKFKKCCLGSAGLKNNTKRS